jgi:D-xylose transport system permease protein
MAIALVVICGFFASVSPQFLSARNLSLLLTELAVTATLALGMLLVILPGHIDLSAGSGVGLLGGLASVLVFEHNFPAPLAMIISLIAGVVIWGALGTLIVREKIPAFICTLGGLLVFKGVFWLVIHNATIPVVLGGQIQPLLPPDHILHSAGHRIPAGDFFGFLVSASQRSAR